MVGGEEEGSERFRRVVQIQAVIFYADYGILASPWPARIQEALEVLTGLFYRVGLRMNVNKMVDITCQPF